MPKHQTFIHRNGGDLPTLTIRPRMPIPLPTVRRSVHKPRRHSLRLAPFKRAGSLAPQPRQTRVRHRHGEHGPGHGHSERPRKYCLHSAVKRRGIPISARARREDKRRGNPHHGLKKHAAVHTRSTFWSMLRHTA